MRLHCDFRSRCLLLVGGTPPRIRGLGDLIRFGRLQVQCHGALQCLVGTLRQHRQTLFPVASYETLIATDNKIGIHIIGRFLELVNRWLEFFYLRRQCGNLFRLVRKKTRQSLVLRLGGERLAVLQQVRCGNRIGVPHRLVDHGKIPVNQNFEIVRLSSFFCECCKNYPLLPR